MTTSDETNPCSEVYIDSSVITTTDLSGYSLTNVGVNDYFINTKDIRAASINWSVTSTPFVDSMPALHEVTEMCEQYPSLAKAYENFKTVYAMVEQDWKGKKK